MKTRIWIIPATLLILVIGAWALRFDTIKILSSGEMYSDRWLGQTYVTSLSGGALVDEPVFTSNDINKTAYELTDPQSVEKIVAFDEEQKKLDTKFQSNKYVYSEYLRYQDIEKQKMALFKPFQNQAKENLSSIAMSKRKTATLVSVIVGSASVIWLIALYILGGKSEEMSKEMEITS